MAKTVQDEEEPQNSSVGTIELSERSKSRTDETNRFARNMEDNGGLLATIESASSYDAISNFFSFIDRISNKELTSSSDQQQVDQERSFLFRDVLKDWVATVIIGCLVVSYWRGTWVLLDIYLCDQLKGASMTNGNSFCQVDDDVFRGKTRYQSAIITYAIGVTFTIVGIAMMWYGIWTPPIMHISSNDDNDDNNDNTSDTTTRNIPITTWRSVLRVTILYILGFGTVCTWRGIWYLTDYWILPYNNPLTSYWVTTLAGSIGSFCLYAGASLLAPPAIFIIDGPSVIPPPLAVTIASSYFSLTLPAGEKAPKLPKFVHFLDILISFLGLTIFIVWFWRGTWYLMDEYLYGFTSNVHDLHISLGYSTIIASACLILGSDDVLYWIRIESKLWVHLIDRFRTIVLAVGAVNFWRVVWLTWDEFLFSGHISHASGWVSHIVGVVGLLVMGCLSCILAPSATLGVDAEPHEECAEEPLFSNIPVPAESLFLYGIGRQVKTSSLSVEISDAERRFSYEEWFYNMQRPGHTSRLNVETADTVFSLRTQKKRRQSSFAFRSR